MILAKVDRGTGEERTLDSKKPEDDFYLEINRLAKMLRLPLKEVQESLVCGMTLRTAGYSYTLID